MKYSINRRNFLKTTALAAGAATVGFPAFVRGQNLNSKLNIAAIGAAGKGVADTKCCATENIVALCDVDMDYSAGQRAKYPEAKFFQDFRKMFDALGKSIDAVTVTTPDHTHAVIATAAMSLGKHVYCQKPLTQTIYEARYLRDMARRKKIITQMGNQGSAEDGLRRAVEVIQSGILGTVKEVHVWSNRPIWPQGMNRPEGSDPVPAGLDWDLWIGPAAMRPFKLGSGKGKRDAGIYNPFNWRGWQDFGTGALGDMACHTVNLPFRALELAYPTEIEGEAIGGMNTESYPIGSKIRFQFPARGKAGHQAPLTFWWYDGGHPKQNNPLLHDGNNKPPRELLADVEAFRGEIPHSGCLIIGSNGTAFAPDDMGAQMFVKLAGETKYTFIDKHPVAMAVPVTIPRNPFKGDGDFRHHQEWIAAIKDNKPETCYSRFDIGAYLTEIMLLGCVALRVGKKIDWDGPNMRVTNAPEAARLVKRDNRAGWVLGA
ncbi:MAG: Gfo/Idh/MocA family oxidoreductase [Verrucomicrobia bacterium]|nr:Gfo/Idh/MocA family oxidoreductase [Verrucomicrobiota bacterium]